MHKEKSKKENPKRRIQWPLRKTTRRSTRYNVFLGDAVAVHFVWFVMRISSLGDTFGARFICPLMNCTLSWRTKKTVLRLCAPTCILCVGMQACNAGPVWWCHPYDHTLIRGQMKKSLSRTEDSLQKRERSPKCKRNEITEKSKKSKLFASTQKKGSSAIAMPCDLSVYQKFYFEILNQSLI